METDTLTVYFRVGSHEYDPSYMGNGKRMEKFLERYSTRTENQAARMVYELDFEVSSSPEGSYQLNHELSRNRAETLENYLKEKAAIADSVIVISHIAEAWDGLTEILRDSDVRWRDAVLQIIEENPQITTGEDGQIIEQRKNKLMAYDGGRPWRYMIRNWFPNLRRFSLLFKSEMYLPELGDVEIEDFDVPFEELTVDDSRPVAPLMPLWIRELTLKTNGIGWGMGHANVAAEIDLAPHWSVSVPFYYSGGFDYFTTGIKFRGIVLQPEARYYFKGNDGWYIGAHAGIGWYNFALNGEYRIQDHKGTRPAWGGGLGFGYQLQFKKNPRWGMEFALGAGVYDVKYDMFYNEENGPYAEVGIHDTFIGIDNATVGVTYKFPCVKKYPYKRKEGRK